MVDRDEWAGLIDGREDPADVPTVQVPYPGGGSWGGPFEAIADDGLSYYVKALGTCPPGQEASLATELIVARAGRLIGAPTCDTTLIRIPDELDGHEVSAGKRLSPGLAHASRSLTGQVDEQRPALDSRDKDDNRRRHVGAYALFDWFIGSDQQWLHEIDNDRTMWSHDHGLYLPPAGTGGWTEGELIGHVATPWPLPDPADGLSPEAIDESAKKLEGLRREQLVAVLMAVPISWPVDNNELETLGWFLESRAPSVAERLRALA